MEGISNGSHACSCHNLSQGGGALVKHTIIKLLKGNLEVKLPTIWRDEKQRRVRENRGVEEGRNREREKSEERRYRCAKC